MSAPRAILSGASVGFVFAGAIAGFVGSLPLALGYIGLALFLRLALADLRVIVSGGRL